MEKQENHNNALLAVLLAKGAAHFNPATQMLKLPLERLSAKVEGGVELNDSEIRLAANLLASPEPSLENKERFLLALSEKGEKPDEIASFANQFRELAIDPKLGSLAEDAIDVCGTGGDNSGSFNISTFVAFTLAAGGVRVLKHGNRSITSQCGSADLLEGVGIPLQGSPDLIRAAAEELNFTFLFAPVFHPAFKEIMPVRKSLAKKGRRTIFNLLGPLINPARPNFQLLGVFSPLLVKPLAETLHALGLKRGLVVHGKTGPGSGIDELTCSGENIVAGFGELVELRKDSWLPGTFGLTTCPEKDLKGGNLEDNLRIMEDILAGRAREGLLATIAANAGTALFIAKKTIDDREGTALAKDIILGGNVRKWLARAKVFYADFASDGG